MEGLEKLEEVQRTIHSLRSVGISDANPDAERFLADFTFFLTQDCGELEVALKGQLITKHMSKIVDLLISGAMQCDGTGCSQIGNALQLHHDDKINPNPVQSLRNDVAVIGIDAMMRSNSTLEDFILFYVS